MPVPQLPFTVVLDGDQRAKYCEVPEVWFLPASNLEELVLGDPAAVREGLLAAVAEADPPRATELELEWTSTAVATYLTANRRPETTALQLLTGLARKMGITYRKAVHTPLLVQELSQAVVDQLKPLISRISSS